MRKFATHKGVVAIMPGDNIDTDQIIPSREMKRVSKRGLGDGLFSGQRYLYDAEEKIGENPNFVLNQPNFRNASILLCGKNFGCGSSREHAVWALDEFGIRALIAESYGEIFFNNALRNGLLPIILQATELAQLHEFVITAEASGAACSLTIDVALCTISTPHMPSISFNLDDHSQQMLLNGWDAITLAQSYEEEFERFANQDKVQRPWAYL